jgi:hypothetical protein
MFTEETKARDSLNYPKTDQFLSEEDLDLKNLSWEELLAVWEAWLKQASITDDLDAHLYSHGVFQNEPL